MRATREFVIRFIVSAYEMATARNNERYLPDDGETRSPMAMSVRSDDQAIVQ